MKKLLLSLSVAALAIAVLVNVAFAFGGAGTTSDMMQYTGTDTISGGEAFWIIPWANDMVDRWGRAYGWKPQTTTIHLYTDGTMMANDLAAFRGSALSDADFGYVSTQVGAITTMDTRPDGPGGFAILVNLNAPQFGGAVGLAPYYRTEVKGAITMELAKMMESDIAGSGGPTWMRMGLVNYLMETEVPGLNNPIQKYVTLNSLMGAGEAPGVMALQNNWTGVVSTSPQMMDAAIAVSTATVRLLVPQIGVNGVLDMINRAGMGGDFNSLLMSMTGMSLNQLDTAYQGPVTSTIQALNAAMAGQTP